MRAGQPRQHRCHPTPTAASTAPQCWSPCTSALTLSASHRSLSETIQLFVKRRQDLLFCSPCREWFSSVAQKSPRESWHMGLRAAVELWAAHSYTEPASSSEKPCWFSPFFPDVLWPKICSLPSEPTLNALKVLKNLASFHTNSIALYVAKWLAEI